jgi:uncharacterized membrane protein
MRNTKTMIGGALTGLIALSAIAATPAMAAPKMQKCYGIAKAHMNDCKTAQHACKGMAMKSRAAGDFVALPAGVCSKIAGGSTHPNKK